MPPQLHSVDLELVRWEGDWLRLGRGRWRRMWCPSGTLPFGGDRSVSKLVLHVWTRELGNQVGDFPSGKLG